MYVRIFDLQLYKNHLLKLDNQDRLLRFGYNISDENIISFVNNINIKDTFFIGYIRNDELIGVIHVSIIKDYADVGMSVLKEHRNKGIGNNLWLKAKKLLDNRNIKTMITQCVSENKPMINLLKQDDGKITREAGEVFSTNEIKKDYSNILEEIQLNYFTFINNFYENNKFKEFYNIK